MSLIPLKVVHVASGDLWAGAEVQLYYLARALHRRDDVELLVILFNHGTLEKRLQADGVRVEVLDEQRLHPWRLMQGLRARLKALRPQVVHSHRYKENLICGLAAWRLGCIAVRTVHSAAPTPHTPGAYLMQFADFIAARFQQGAVCVSPELLEQVQARFPSLPLAVIENGIDYDELTMAAATPIDATVLGSGIRVGFVGRLVSVKRPDLFVAMAHHLAREIPGRYSFHLFGDGPLLQECEEFVARHRIADDVRLLGFRPNLPAWLSKFDALVICSDHEGLPMVLLEAMALQIPVIAHAVGGMPHVLGCGQFGTLVREHTPDGYADALQAMEQHPEETATRARLAQAHVQTRYAIEATAERYLRFYRGLQAAPARPRGVVYD